MLRTTNPQPSLWEQILPPALLGLPAELARVDALLDDEAFLAPFRPHFHPSLGRPSVPIDTYLRMLFLKFRYGLGDELLCREVADSISRVPQLMSSSSTRIGGLTCENAAAEVRCVCY